VHILYSGMRSPRPPVINHAGPVFSAYGFTLEDVIVRAWEGNPWHVDMTRGLSDDTRFDFLMVLPQQEPTASCLGLLKSAIERHFAVDVKLETRMREVYVLSNTNSRGQMLRRYPDSNPGTGFSLLAFSVFRGGSPDAPMFPLDAFTVHSVPFLVLVKWFEERTGDRRNRSAWNLRVRAEGACEHAGGIYTAIARRSGTSDHAAAARDTDAHCAAAKATS
jgi:hypothetical protein